MTRASGTGPGEEDGRTLPCTGDGPCQSRAGPCSVGDGHPNRREGGLELGILGTPGVGLGIAGCSDAGRLDEGVIKEGETLFRSTALCFACHGPNGQGVPGTGVDLTDEWLHGDGSFKAIVRQTLNGLGPTETKSGIMVLPKGGSVISDEQVRAVAAYVWSLSRRGRRESVPNG